MADKSFAEVLERFRTIAFDEQFDLIVAVANGGVVPAGILAQRFGLERGGVAPEVRLLRINLRDEHQRPRFDAPRLLIPIDFDYSGRRVLLVDDRIKSGSTIRLARELLSRGEGTGEVGQPDGKGESWKGDGGKGEGGMGESGKGEGWKGESGKGEDGKPAKPGAALVRTFAVNGPADYSLYDEPCFRFPWIV